MDDHAMRDTLKGFDQVKKRHGVLVIAGGRSLRLSRGAPGGALGTHTTAAKKGGVRMLRLPLLGLYLAHYGGYGGLWQMAHT